MAKATWIKIDGAWKQIKNVWVNVGGVWKQKVMPKGRINSMWKEFMAYITSWMVKVDTPNRSNRTPVQADKEGNSFFLDYKGVSYSYYLVKYSPDGKLLAEKSLSGYVILGWYIFGDCIYYQEVVSSSSANYGPIKRINIKTLEISIITGNVNRTNFIHVDYEKDLVVVGTEDYYAKYFKLSTGEQLKNILFAAGQVIGSEYPYYYVQRYNSYYNETTIIKFNSEDGNRAVWTYTIRTSNGNKIVGQDNNYIYILDNVSINSTFRRVFIKLNKSDGKAETTLLGDDYYPYGSDYLLYEGYFYRISNNGFLEKYGMDFKLLASKNLNIEDGYSYEGLRMVAEVGYLYFTLPSGMGTITNQIWGSEKLI